VGLVLRLREREKVAKPDEGRWDETIPAGEVSDLLRSTIQLRTIRGCRLLSP